MKLKKGWKAEQIVGKEDWFVISTPYFRSNGKLIDFVYNPEIMIAHDEGETDFQMGKYDRDWFLDTGSLMLKYKLEFIDDALSKKIERRQDLYDFGKVLWLIDRHFSKKK